MNLLLMNKETNHWVSRRDFQVRGRKGRGGQREDKMQLLVTPGLDGESGWI